MIETRDRIKVSFWPFELSSRGSWRIAAPCRDTDNRIARSEQLSARD
jgi:hypothetical protein